MRQRTLLSGLFGIALGCAAIGTTALLEKPAHARPLRHQNIHALLLDLAQIESVNFDRDDQRAAQLIQQQVVNTRAGLLQMMVQRSPRWIALRQTLNNLYTIASFNDRSQDRDAEVLLRVAGSVENMRLRAEQMMRMSGPDAPPPPPPHYRIPTGYQPVPYEPIPRFPGPNPGTVYTPPQPPPVVVAPPPAPPVYQPQPPVYQPQPPVYQPQPPVYQPPVVVYQPPQPATPPPMDPGRFAGMLSRMQRAAFADAKMGIVQDEVTSGNYFTCEQIAQLMRTSPFGDDQVKLGSTLYSRAVDPQNFSTLTSVLTFESDRQKLRRAVGR